MGFSPVAVVQQVHNRQVTHITRSNNTFNQTQYTKHNKNISDFTWASPWDLHCKPTVQKQMLASANINVMTIRSPNTFIH
jgi:hypothetical protein